MNLNELTIDNIGIWPNWVKGVVIGVLCLLIILLFYFFDVKSLQSTLTQSQLEEQDLRSTFEVKYGQAVNLPAYKAQISEIQHLIVNMLGQLPQTLDVPNLIEDISKMGISAGLEFETIKPQPEVEKDFYTELPIQITVTGNYHQLAEFVSNLANLQRIVTLDDFTIEQQNKDISELRKANRADAVLEMQITAKTYKQSNAYKQAKKKGQTNKGPTNTGQTNTGANNAAPN